MTAYLKRCITNSVEQLQNLISSKAQKGTEPRKQKDYTMTISITNKIRVGDFDFANITIPEWIATPEVSNNRNSKDRVNKMKSVFNEALANNQHNTLTEVALGVVLEEFEDPDTGTKYTPGEQVRLDGSTRANWWEENPNLHHYFVNGLTAKIHYLRSWQDVEYAYYPYNSAKSAESKRDILQGLARRYQWNPNQSVFAKGGYGSALDWATRKPTGNNTWESENTFKAFHDCIDTLRILDGLPKNSDYSITAPAYSKLKSQAIIAATLVMLKNYGGNLKLHEFIYRLSNITHNDTTTALSNNEVDPVEIIALEWSGMSALRTGHDKQPWLCGAANQTKFSTVVPQMDFLLHWIGRYIQNPTKKYKLSGGGVKEMWSGTWAELAGDDE